MNSCNLNMAAQLQFERGQRYQAQPRRHQSRSQSSYRAYAHTRHKRADPRRSRVLQCRYCLACSDNVRTVTEAHASFAFENGNKLSGTAPSRHDTISGAPLVAAMTFVTSSQNTPDKKCFPGCRNSTRITIRVRNILEYLRGLEASRVSTR